MSTSSPTTPSPRHISRPPQYPSENSTEFGSEHGSGAAEPLLRGRSTDFPFEIGDFSNEAFTESTSLSAVPKNSASPSLSIDRRRTVTRNGIIHLSLRYR